MAHTGHSDVGSDEPPTFVVVGDRDNIAPPAVRERRVAALRRMGTDVEYHRYPGAGHAFGPGRGTRAEGWIGDAIRFWARQIAPDVDGRQDRAAVFGSARSLAGRLSPGFGEEPTIAGSLRARWRGVRHYATASKRPVRS